MKTIEIHDTRPAAGCGSCHHDAERGPVCRATLDPVGQAPQLSGPASLLAQVLAALVVRTGCRADGAGLVRSLRLAPGEADLQLAVPSQCGGAALVNTAFEALRDLLPDTDIYVRPAG